jgi:hypothetical protein|tara:strand:+ start:126 stop:335 length:210 start_codon:yes stop_codon:yes gene_type:complete
MRGPIAQIPTPVDLDKVLGRPTGQGFGAARKGPSVQGPIEAVSDETYDNCVPFKVDSVKTIGNYGQTGD